MDNRENQGAETETEHTTTLESTLALNQPTEIPHVCTIRTFLIHDRREFDGYIELEVSKPFGEVMMEFSRQENIPHEAVSFWYGKECIEPWSTPEELGMVQYTVVFATLHHAYIFSDNPNPPVPKQFLILQVVLAPHQGRFTRTFRMRASTNLAKIFRNCLRALGLRIGDASFHFANTTLDGSSCPLELGMKDGDVLEIRYQDHISAKSAEMSSLLRHLCSSSTTLDGENGSANEFYRLVQAIHEGPPMIANCTDDLEGCGALHLAARCGKVDYCRLFIARGADCNAKDKKGKTPIDYAFERPTSPLNASMQIVRMISLGQRK